jgi:hypothetical protein
MTDVPAGGWHNRVASFTFILRSSDNAGAMGELLNTSAFFVVVCGSLLIVRDDRERLFELSQSTLPCKSLDASAKSPDSPCFCAILDRLERLTIFHRIAPI